MSGGLIVRFQGEVKSGKTLSAVRWTFNLAAKAGIDADHIFTNMKGCYDHRTKIRVPNGKGGWMLIDNPNFGRRWARTVSVDDIIIDLNRNDDEFEIERGVLLLDEAQTIFRTDYMKGHAGGLMTNIVNQCGKRGLALIYTTHLSRMVAPVMRELTMLDILCRTEPQYPNSILWDITDGSAVRLAQARGFEVPAPTPWVLHNIRRWFGFYETDEVISPLSWQLSAASSKTGKKLLDSINAVAKAKGIDLGIDALKPPQEDAQGVPSREPEQQGGAWRRYVKEK